MHIAVYKIILNIFSLMSCNIEYFNILKINIAHHFICILNPEGYCGIVLGKIMSFFDYRLITDQN